MTDVPVLTPQVDIHPQRIPAAKYNIDNCYWRKAKWEKEAGWIIVGPGPDTEQGKFWRDRGREPLEKLSLTDRINPETRQAHRIEYNADNLAMYRYYWLFQNGGGKEFPIEQIVAHMWHIKPPYGMSKEVFPQLEDYDLPEPLWCALCSPNTPPKNTPQQLIQHGMIGHKLNMNEAKALLADASKPPTGGALDPVIRRKRAPRVKAAEEAERAETRARLEAEAGDIKDPTKHSLNICNNCSELIEGKLADHNCL